MIQRLLIFLFLFITITVCSHAQQNGSGPPAIYTLQDGSKLAMVSDWVPSLMHLKDSVSRLRLKKVNGYYIAFVNFETDSTKEYEIEIRKKVVVATPPKPDLIKDIDGAITEPLNKYVPAWLHFTNAVFHKSTASYSPTTGAKLTVSFTGYKVEWFSEKARNHGIAGVKIDGVQQTSVDLYGNTTVNNSQKVFEWTGTEGVHTIEITVTGTKNTAATESNVIHDYFRTYSKQ